MDYTVPRILNHDIIWRVSGPLHAPIAFTLQREDGWAPEQV